MCPITHASYLAIGLSVAAAFILGFLWYGPLFGKVWAGLMGFKMDPDKCAKPPVSSLLISILGSFFTVFAMAFLLNNKAAGCSCHVGLAGLIWLGFYVPGLLGSVIWEGRSWKLFALNAAYCFLNLQLISAILTYAK